MLLNVKLDSFIDSKYRLKHARNAKTREPEQHNIDITLKTIEQYIRRNGEIYGIITQADKGYDDFTKTGLFQEFLDEELFASKATDLLNKIQELITNL